MTEALLAVEDAPQGQADLLGLVEELGSQLAVGEGPPVVAVLKGEGEGEQHGLLSLVAGQGEGGDTAHVDGVVAADDGVQHVVLRAQHATGAHVDGDGAAGLLLHQALELRGGLAHDGVQGVDLGVHQGHLGVVGHIAHVGGLVGVGGGGGLAALGGAAVLAAGLAAAGGQAHDHEQSQNSGQELLQFHFDILLKFMVASFEILPSETHCTTKNKFCPLVY